MRTLPRMLLGCAAVAAAVPAPALGDRIRPVDVPPLVAPGYTATDDDERGLWQVSDKLEQEIARSNLLIDDPQLIRYVRGILNRLIGEPAADIRIYIVRNPDFNASMFPNGMMLVHTGLLARMRNEAQLAAVLGHEAGHYFRRHTVTRWRDMKNKTAIMSIVSLTGAAASGATGTNWYNLANAVNVSLLLSVFSYSRFQEEEADAYGLRLLADAGYSPHAAGSIWAQLIDERKASAAARDKRYYDRSLSAASTHPPTEERMADLKTSADEIVQADPAARYDERQQQWLDGIGPLRWALLEEQVLLNDDGASVFLLNALAQDGWNSGLYYYLGKAYSLRGNDGDEELAAQSYASAVEFEDPLPVAFRDHGYAQLKQGNNDAGRAALASYLALQPDAPDAPMVQFSIQQ